MLISVAHSTSVIPTRPHVAYPRRAPAGLDGPIRPCQQKFPSGAGRGSWLLPTHGPSRLARSPHQLPGPAQTGLGVSEIVYAPALRDRRPRERSLERGCMQPVARLGQEQPLIGPAPFSTGPDQRQHPVSNRDPPRLVTCSWPRGGDQQHCGQRSPHRATTRAPKTHSSSKNPFGCQALVVDGRLIVDDRSSE